MKCMIHIKSGDIDNSNQPKKKKKTTKNCIHAVINAKNETNHRQTVPILGFYFHTDQHTTPNLLTFESFIHDQTRRKEITFD